MINFFKKAKIAILLTMILLTVSFRVDIFNGDIVSAATVPDFTKNELLINGKDSGSIVFFIVGDGFRKEDQELFNQKAAEVKDYIINTYPFNELKDYMNFYSLNVISNESGAADNTNELKDTYFQCSYNYAYNIERLLAPVNSYAAVELADYYVPDYDYILMIANDDRYGGSGGFIPVASTNEYSYEILVHEMGHSIGGLSDEYWAGSYYAYESVNMTQEADPGKVPWSDLIGVNGIGVFPYTEDPSWYHPSENCKMEYLGKEYPFCEVCARTLENQLEDLRWKTNSINSYQDLLSKITVAPAKKTLYIGDSSGKTVKISAKIPAILKKVSNFTETDVNADNMQVKITYKSSNTKIASVSAGGTITAKSKGKAVITVIASLVDGTSMTYQINISVMQAKSKK
jgi:hypothetical protein